MRDDLLRQLALDLAPIVHAISGVNTLQRPVFDARYSADRKFLFPGRDSAGISGIAIHQHCRRFVQVLSDVKRSEEDASFDIIAMGGVSTPEAFAELMHLGAAAVQAATGVLMNPLLAQDCSAYADALPGGDAQTSLEVPQDSQTRAIARQAVVDALREQPIGSEAEIAAAVGIRVGRTLQALDELEDSGVVRRITKSGGPHFRLTGAPS